MTTLAYSYVRMSTERQQKGDSIRRQLEWSAAFAERHALVLDDSVRDIGVSAWRGKNRKKGALGEFLKKVEEGEVPRGSYLLVESLDRLSRDQVMEALALFQNILRQGVTIATMDPEQVYTLEGVNRDFSQLLIALTLMSRANEESERKSSRIRQAMQNKREMARAGRRTVSKTPSWITATKLDRDDYSYEINHLGPVIADIFQMSAEGLSIKAITRALNQRRLPSPRGSDKGWWDNTVHKIIQSRSAIGEFQPMTVENDRGVPIGEPIKGYYPAVVSVDLWQRAQKQPQPREKGVKGTGFHNLLGDLARCAHCGNRMMLRGCGKPDGIFPYTYYLQCRTGRFDGQCKHGKAAFRYRYVEDTILDHIKEFAFADVLQLRRKDDALAAARERVAQAQHTQAALGEQSDNLLNVLAVRPDNSQLLDRLDALERQITEAKAEYSAAERILQAEEVRSQNEDPTDLVQQLRAEWLSATEDSQRYALRARCQAALREYVQQIDFDGRNEVFRVIIKGGERHPVIRAYEFNKKQRWGRNHVSRMRVVDLVPFMATDEAYGDLQAAARRGIKPLKGAINIEDCAHDGLMPVDR